MNFFFFVECIVFEFFSENFCSNFTSRNFEGRTLRVFSFDSLLVPQQTLYLLFRISD